MARKTKPATPRRSTSAVSEAPSYELDFICDSTPSPVAGSVGAFLRSPALDPALHPDGSIGVEFGSRRPPSEEAENGFVIDSFQIASLVEYVRAQSTIRNALDTELAAERSKWPNKSPARRGPIWQHAKVKGIAIYPRNVPSPTLLANMLRLHAKRAVKETLACADTLDTRSAFLVYVRLSSWDYRALFRDGALVTFELL